MSISPMAETKSISAGVPDIGPGDHSPTHGGHGPGGPSPFGAHYGASHHGAGDPYSHHYYPQQNSPYFPMYQPHYHHHYHQPHSEPVRYFHILEDFFVTMFKIIYHRHYSSILNQ